MSEKAEKISQGVDAREQSNKRELKSPLAAYFFIVLLSFSVVSVLLNSLLSHSHPEHGHLGTGGNAAMKIRLQQSLKHPNELSAAEKQAEEMTDDGGGRSLVGLDCVRHGGPDDTSEFVYWQDIPQDSQHISPFHRKRKGHTDREQYLTFEPDNGGWNNIRMGMETILALAFAMGRTLVLPPEKEVSAMLHLLLA